MENLQVGHRYLVKSCSYSSYNDHIMELKFLENSNKSYKFKDMITSRIFWVNKDQFKSTQFASDGYFLQEDLGLESDKKQLLKG